MHKDVSILLRVLSMIREYFSGKGEDCLKFHGIELFAQMCSISRAKKLCAQKYRIRNLNGICRCSRCLSAFPLPLRPLAFYRDIGTDHSTLKLYFTPSNYTQARVASGTFSFFPSFRLSLLVRFLLPLFTLPPFRYIFARFLHSSSFEPSEKGFVREPFIFSCVSRPDVSEPTSRW